MAEDSQIFLVRHAQSVANAGHPTSDFGDIPLTGLGMQQAEVLAGIWRCSPTLIVLSPFERALQTAEPTCRRFPHVPREIWPVHEHTSLDAAPLAGMTMEQRKPFLQAYWNRNDLQHRDGPGAETFLEFLDRTRQAMQRLASLSPGSCVIVFTHGLWMQAFRLCVLFPAASDQQLMENIHRINAAHPIANTEVQEFHLRGILRPVSHRHLDSFRLAPGPPARQ